MEWYYLDNKDNQVGPVTEAELKNLASAGGIKKETMVWNDSMDNWLPAMESAIATLFAISRPPPPKANTSKNLPPPPQLSPAVGFGRDDTLVYPTNPPRSPHIAWLTLLGPGLAQIVFGKTSMGIAGIVTFNVINVFCQVPGAEILGLLILPLWIVMIVDGYMTGNRLKEGTPVGKWQFFPKKK